MRILIVGGGIMGMLSAYLLRKQGAEVILMEQAKTGTEASWAGGGMLTPLYPWRHPDTVIQLTRRSQVIYPELAQELAKNSGIDCEYEVSGMLVLDTDESDAAFNWAERYQITIEYIDANEIQILEPSLHQQTSGALWFPTIAHIRNPRLLKALRLSLERLGVILYEHERMENLHVSGDRVTAVVSNKDIRGADQVILCAGAWTTELLALFSNRLPIIEPIRGQMLLLQARPGQLKRITVWNDRYAIPRRDGLVLFGSTLEYAGFNKETTKEAGDDLYTEALRRYPVLEKAKITRHWAGLRPGSPSGVPYICRHPDYTNLFLNTGHFRNGVVLALASCELLLSIMDGSACEEVSAPFDFDAVRC